MSVMIKQRYRGDCSIASLAMMLGKSYEEIEEHFTDEDKQNGVWNDKKFQIAAKFGLYLGCKFCDDFDKGRPAIVVLPSLNRPNTRHCCYWDGKELFDPSPNICYEILPEHVGYAFQKAD